MLKETLSLALCSCVLAAVGCGQPDEAPALDENTPAGLVAIPDEEADYLAQATIDKVKAAAVVTLINQYRATGYRCPDGVFYPKAAPLIVNAALTKASELHSADMADKNYFSHTSRDGRTPLLRAKNQGYSGSYLGENIAAGNSTADASVKQWLGSLGHCKNLMNANYKSTGVGVANTTTSTYKWYWTQMFGNP